MSRLSRRMPAVAATTAVLIGGSLLGASASQAVAPPKKPYGTVTTKALNVRQYPSTDSKPKGTLHKGQQRGLDCKVRAQYIKGNTIWYKLRGAPERWVSARYVNNHGHVMYCKDKYRAPKALESEAQNAVG